MRSGGTEGGLAVCGRVESAWVPSWPPIAHTGAVVPPAAPGEVTELRWSHRRNILGRSSSPWETQTLGSPSGFTVRRNPKEAAHGAAHGEAHPWVPSLSLCWFVFPVPV